MTKLGSYLRFVAGGIAAGSKNGQLVEFINNEISTKFRRLRNERMRRRFEHAGGADFVAITPPEELPDVRVLSLCHGGGIPEQKLSMLSFLRHVGAPQRWSVVSDGTITESQAANLCSLHPRIEVIDWKTFINDQNRSCFEVFSKHTVFAKKFALESNFPVDKISLYTDTDVVFFEGGYRLRNLLKSMANQSFYQQDLPGYLDKSILTDDEFNAPPLNAGFFIQGMRIDWSLAIKRLETVLACLDPNKRHGDLEKLEQAITHAAHYMAGSKPLDESYVLQISDRLQHSDAFAGPACAMRHYVRPVRHKMWPHARGYLK